MTFDGNTFLDISVKGDASIGGEAKTPALSGAPETEWTEIQTAFEDAAVQLAKDIYARLDDTAREKAEKGLE